MKSMHGSESGQAITGSTKIHVISRLEKAKKTAGILVDTLKDPKSGVNKNTLLEAQAYQAMLSGTLYFESRKWLKSLESYSIVHVLYTILLKSSASRRAGAFQELLTSIVEPSIRYAAYQQKLPRTMPIPQIVTKYASKDSVAIQTVLELDPKAFDEQSTEAKIEKGEGVRELPKTISWRTRTVPIEDASISEALASVYEAERKLAKSKSSNISSKEKAAAYDDILVPSQDAVDAVKTAIDELTAEGVSSADRRLQALQVTRTALNYALVSRRVGRDRVLCGLADGAYLEATKGKKGKEETNGMKMARLRERVVLYDSILQSLDSIKELPGVAADQALGKELESKRSYFLALRLVLYSCGLELG
jgi:signal recognition particle subunit SRP68